MSDRETVPGTVVVGVDGSEGSLHALDWAIDAAAGRGATLRLVYAMGLPLVTVPLGGPIRTAPSRKSLKQQKRSLKKRCGASRRPHPACGPSPKCPGPKPTTPC